MGERQPGAGRDEHTGKGGAERARLALWTRVALLVAVLLFVYAAQLLPRLIAAIIGACLCLLGGLHLIVFRREDAAALRGEREHRRLGDDLWDIHAAARTPALKAISGVFLVCLALMFLLWLALTPLRGR